MLPNQGFAEQIIIGPGSSIAPQDGLRRNIYRAPSEDLDILFDSLHQYISGRIRTVIITDPNITKNDLGTRVPHVEGVEYCFRR